MESDQAAAEAPSTPHSPASPLLEPQGDEHERGAVESTADPALPEPQPSPATPPQPQQTDGEDAAGNGEVVQESVAVSEALRKFMEQFGDQGEECIVQSPQLKNLATPDRAAVLRFLGGKYNNLLDKYKMLSSKCTNECVPRYNDLKKKYTDQCMERRRLNNELIEIKGNIRVFCRCRPLSADELTRCCSSVIEIDPLCETELQFLSSEKEKKAFRFDHVFGPEDSQEAVFAETLPVVQSVMDGFNVCIFAYGQTGTGKTFTMEGVPENRGVNYRALEELFRMSEARSVSVAYTFSVSILEVYNEQINDLLDESSKKLEIKQNPDGTQDVPGLVDAPIYTIDGVWEKLKVGARNRSVGSTNVNELSSRSHCLVRVTVRSEDLVTGQRRRSRMWLVDLAGSERVAKTGVEGDMLAESISINKSLTCLGDVMSALASKSSHIPYRNSKLTRLLQNSLGGSCKTLMFVQISPSSTDAGETLNSLKYASRVRSVEHGPARKQADAVESSKLKQMAEKLRNAEKENEELKRRLQLEQLKNASRENIFRSLNDKVRDAEQTCRTYQQRNKELQNELANEKKAARDPARSSRPPLVPMRQRQPPQGRNSNYLPPSGPPRPRFSKAPTSLNKENIPVMGMKAHPGVDKENAVGKARRVSMTPVMRQIPLQPKRRASMAILPSLSEQLASVHAGKRASRLSYLQMPRSSIAFPGALGAAARVPSYVTPDGREEKVRRINFGSSSKFSSPTLMDLLKRNNVPSTPQQRLGLPPGPGNASKLCFSVQKRVQISPIRVKPSAGIFNPAPRDKAMVVGRAGNALRVLNPKRRQSVI